MIYFPHKIGGVQMTLGERIRAVRLAQNPKISQTEFGELTGATRAQVKTYELDTVTAPDSYLQLLALKFGYSYVWLKDGAGEMEEVPADIQTLAAIERILNGENEFVKFVFRKAAGLDKSIWDAIENELKEYFETKK
jgi:transcriptional regulator with XRE-family HTH domain